MFEQLVIRTKLTPPRPRRRTLHRPRVTARLAEVFDHRLTLVHAGTGYGKSTALAALAEQEASLCWYSIADEDADPFVFLLHLTYAFRLRLPEMSDAPLLALERQDVPLAPTATDGGENGFAAGKATVDALINALAEVLDSRDRPIILVLDDYHLVDRVPQIATLVSRLISYAPQALSVTLAGRHPPDLPGLVTWRARGQVLEIDHTDLAFTSDEVAALFREQYGHQLSPREVKALTNETEGWIIALQLIWQGLRNGALTDLSALDSSPATLDHLFTYLTQEILDQQSPDVRGFLLTTAVLRQLTPDACNALRQTHDSAALLAYLYERDLFLVNLGDGPPSEGFRHGRYHHLFHDFLRKQLSAARARQLHQRAADHYCSTGNREEAIYHLLTAHSYEAAANLLDELGERLVRQGRLETLVGWIGQLPPPVLEDHPTLLTCLGDIARLRSHFDEALGWYAQAEARWRAQGDRVGASRALQSQALIYLDTVRPARAEHLLTQALRLSEGLEDRQNRARLLELMAENQLNLGHPQEAQRLRAEARQWREEGPSESQLGVRVLIRTGQLKQAQAILERQAASESKPTRPPNGQTSPPRAHQSHRETQLLLSLVYAFQGRAEAAFEAAQTGIAIGRKLGSPFVTAVGYMRLGHAWLIRPAPSAHLQAIECFKQAITLSDVVAVRRTRVEAQWGLCRAYGFHDDLVAAQEAAALGIEIGRRAGDLWVVALIQLTLSASYVLAGQYTEALQRLPDVIATFRDCSDSYGRTAAHLWLALAYLYTQQNERLTETADVLLKLTETHNYDHLFTRRALLNPPDNRILVPLLLEARRRRRRPGTVARLLDAMGLAEVEFHPGYQLCVQTLGPFRVWRGKKEIEAREWRRSKALQLFQLFLTHRGRLMQREEIVDILWPDLEPDAVQRDFKVALNALNKALEPARAPGAEPAYIVRHGTTYGLRPGADLWLDAEEFQRLIRHGSRYQGDVKSKVDLFQQALDLYQDDYLQEALYEDWASEERERLLALYLRTAEKLAALHVDQNRYDEAIDLCQRILARDNCWERAYRLMMVAYARQGNRPQALRIYHSCQETLQRELNAGPGPATRQLHAQISAGAPTL